MNAAVEGADNIPKLSFVVFILFVFFVPLWFHLFFFEPMPKVNEFSEWGTN